MQSARLRRSRTQETPVTSLPIRNIVVGGHRTSVRLEPIMWEALQDIARRLGMRLNDLVTEIDRHRGAPSLTAAIRVYIVHFYRNAATAGAVREAVAPKPS